MQDPRAISKRAGALGAAAVLAFSGLLFAPAANADDAGAEAAEPTQATAQPTKAATPAESTAPAPAATVAEDAAGEGTADQAELAPGLAEALMRDLGMTLEEFIAAGELGEKAAEALPALEQIDGFVSLRLEAGNIVVTGSGDELAAAVEELGAVLEAPAEDVTVEAEGSEAGETAAPEAPVEASEPAAEQEDEAEDEPAAGSSVAESVDHLLQEYVKAVGSTENLRSVMLTGPGTYTIKLGAPLEALPAQPSGSLIRMASAPRMTPAQFDAEYANVKVEEVDQTLTTFQDVPGGAGIISATDDALSGVCSIGFNGFVGSDPAAITAGHCTGDGAANLAFLEPLEGETEVDTVLGTYGFSQFGGENNSPTPNDTTVEPNRGTDIALIENINEDLDLTAEVTRRGGNTNPNADTVSVTGSADVVLGSEICKSGRTTFWTCGTVSELGIFFVGGGGGMDDIRAVWGFGSANLVAAPGDSGGSIVSGTSAVGLISAGIEGEITNGALLSDARTRIPEFSLAMSISKPELTNPTNGGRVLTGQPITGSVEGAPAGTTVELNYDGDKKTVDVDANGTWVFTAPGVPDEDSDERELEFTARAVNGQNKSATAEFNLTLEKAPLNAPVFTTPATVVGEIDAISGTGTPGATLTLKIDTAAQQGEAAALAELPLTETVEVAEDGAWSIEFDDALQPGTYRATAAQTMTGMKDSQPATLDLSVIHPAPSITNLADGQEFTEGSTPESITGTAKPGATVTIAIGNALATGTTEADEDGRWSYDVEPWAAGEYRIIASQLVAGVGSDSTQLTVRVAALQVAPGGSPDPADPANPGNPGNPGTGGGNGNSNDADLADTGANGVGAAAAAGLLLVGGGAGALLLNRRRRGAHAAERS